jgi:hypothetical protein
MGGGGGADWVHVLEGTKMVQATDDDAGTADNVHPFPAPPPEPLPRSRRRGKDRRAAARQAKRRNKIKPDRDASAANDTIVYAPPIAPAVTPIVRNGVTVTSRETLSKPAPNQTVERTPRYASIPLVAIAYGFFALGVSINIWNAMTGGPIANMILPAAMGVLAEAVMFFLPERTISLRWASKLLAWTFLAFVAAFALTNSLRMASIVSADQAAARADRQTEGVRTADHALESARAKRDEACGRGLGKTVACQSRQAEVTKLEAKQVQATNKVAAQAKPESTDFARLVAWLSNGALRPGSDDFEMLWLFFRTLLPQVGGLVLMLARR